MTGVLVDDQAFGHDPISHGFLIDSTFSTTPVSSCAGSYTHLHSPLSQHPASYHQISPHLLRSISSPDWKSRELNQLLPQISPLLHSRSQGLASFDADASCDSMKQGTSLNLGGRRGGAEDFAANAFVHELGAKAVAKAAFEVPTLDAALFGGLCGAEFKSAQAPFFASDVGSKIGAHCSGTEADEQGLRSPFSCGTPLWSQSIGGSLAGSPTLPDAILALQKFLPSNLEDDEGWPAVDVYTCDEFRMFEFKVRRCMRGRSHDWTECPFAHPGEKARRRDPRRFHYSGIACPDFRKGNCKRGDTCEYAHGVFECWLHPARYRTQPCKDGTSCKRRVCFFAHTPEQLRLLPAAAQAASRTGGHPSSPRSSFTQKLAQCPSYDGSPLRAGMGVSAEATIQTIDIGASPPSPGVERQSFDRIAPRCNGSMGRGTNMNFYHFGSSPLSPPLSPSGSPPPSPGTSVEWPSSCLATTAPVTQVSGSMTQAGVSQLQASVGLPMRSMPGNSSASVHRRHLDRLNSMPSLPILSSDLRRPYLPLSSMPSSPHASSGTSILSSKQMSELIATIKHLELAGAEPYWLPTQDVRASQMAASRCSSGPSPLSHSASVPSTPRWPTWIDSEGEFWGSMEMDGGPCLERVESGWCLRAKIYENLMMKGSQKDSLDDQDVGWVNELVKEETYQK